jgi:hypothetical protein
MASSSSWGFGGAFRDFSTRLFGDDLAGELDPSVVVPAPLSTVPPQQQQQQQQPDNSMHQEGNLHQSSSLGPLHMRSFPEHQATATPAVTTPRPAALSPDQLQQSMKQLMKQPKLWALYKEELSAQAQPTHPDTVRRTLVEFLEQHGHEITPCNGIPAPTPSKRASLSIFQGWNMGLEEESTHVSKSRPNPFASAAESSSSSEDIKDDLQSRMKRLMKHKELWKEFKNLLYQEETPDDPNTIRRSLVDFWEQHEDDLLRFEAQAATTAALLSSPAPNPARPSSSSSSKKRISIFQAFNTDLDGESQHHVALSSKSSSRRPLNQNPPQRIPTQDTTQQQLRLLRNSPGLYAQYQERLLMDESEEDTSATDLLTKFLQEHASELAELDRAEQEAKEQEARDASLLYLETATLAEEQSETKFNRGPQAVHSLSNTTSSDEHHQPPHGLRPDHRQKMLAYRDSISSRSMRSVQNAMGALAGEMDDDTTAGTSTSASSTKTTVRSRLNLMSQSEHHPTTSTNQSDRRQTFMAYRESFSSTSKRAITNLLAGEVEDTPTIILKEKSSKSLSSHSEHISSSGMNQRDRRQQLMAYGESISSTSKRAMDALAGEMGATQHEHEQPQSRDLNIQAHNRNKVESSDPHSEAPDLKSTLASLKAWRQSLTFSMTSELEELSKETEDLNLKGVGPFQSSAKDEEEKEDDLILRHATNIADRRRRSSSRNSAVALEPIVDDEEEDMLDGNTIVSEHLGATSGAPTTDTATELTEEEVPGHAFQDQPSSEIQEAIQPRGKEDEEEEEGNTETQRTSDDHLLPGDHQDDDSLI